MAVLCHLCGMPTIQYSAQIGRLSVFWLSTSCIRRGLESKVVSRDTIVDRQFVTARVREWVTNIRFMRHAVPSTVVRRRRKLGSFRVRSVQASVGENGNYTSRRGNKFPSIYNHCTVMANWSRKTLKTKFFEVFVEKMTPYGKISQILFRKDSSPHRLTCCVQISWNLADGKSVKSWVAYLTKNISPGSSALATAQIATEICQGQLPRMYTQSAPVFIQIGSLSVEFFPNASTPLKRAVKCFQHLAEV